MSNAFKFKRTLGYVALFLALALVSFGLQTAMAAHQNEDGGYEYKTALTGAAEIPAVVTDTEGNFELTVNEEKTDASFTLQVQNGEAITAAHLHCGDVNETGPVFAHLFGNIPGGFDVDGNLASFTLTDANIQSASSSCDTAITNIATMMLAIDAGNVYVNVHNTAYPNGVIRGQVTANVGGGVGTSTATSTPPTTGTSTATSTPESPDTDDDDNSVGSQIEKIQQKIELIRQKLDQRLRDISDRISSN